MPSDEKKEPWEGLREKFRSFLGLQGPQKKKNALPPKAHFSIWYFLMALLLFSFLQQYFLSGKVETIPYGQFRQELAEGNVSKLTIGPENITGTRNEGGKGTEVAFTTIRVDDPGLLKDLDERKVSYSGHCESKFLSSVLSWIIPIGFFS